MSTDKFDAFAGITPDPVDAGRGGAERVQEIDRVADAKGFPTRQAPEIPIKRQRGTEDGVHQFTMRVRVRASNKFVLWCEKHRLSYREGFDKLVELLDRLDP